MSIEGYRLSDDPVIRPRQELALHNGRVEEEDLRAELPSRPLLLAIHNQIARLTKADTSAQVDEKIAAGRLATWRKVQEIEELTVENRRRAEPFRRFFSADAAAQLRTPNPHQAADLEASDLAAGRIIRHIGLSLVEMRPGYDKRVTQLFDSALPYQQDEGEGVLRGLREWGFRRHHFSPARRQTDEDSVISATIGVPVAKVEEYSQIYRLARYPTADAYWLSASYSETGPDVQLELAVGANGDWDPVWFRQFER